MNVTKKLGLFSVILVLTALLTVPLTAQVVIVNDLPGVRSTSGQLELVRQPASVSQGDAESDTQMIAFIEKENFALTRGLRVNINAPGTYNTVAQLQDTTIASGTRINSYFVHFDRTLQPAQTIQLSGTITFDNDIIGVIVLTDELNASTINLGASGTIYGTGHGLEFGDQDTVTISSNRRTITLDLANNIQTDQVRIITGQASVTPTNNNPVAANDSASTRQNVAVVINVLNNDTDPNNNINRSSLRITSNPSNGTTSINSSTQAVTYTPNSGFRGTDSFVYQICDTTSTPLCDTATVTITVTATGGGDDGGLTLLTILPEADDCSRVEQATIDIVPGNRENLIRLDDLHGITSVAILATEEFPAPNCVDISTISFGRTGDEQAPIACGAVNTNLDKWVDIVCDFDTSRLDFRLGDTSGSLLAETIDNGVIDESDDVMVVAPRRFPQSMRGQSVDIKTLSIGRTLYFVGQGDVAEMKVEVFSLTGQRVYESGFASGNALRWNLRSSEGSRLANGVYFYVVTAKDSYGQVTRHLVKMAMILR